MSCLYNIGLYCIILNEMSNIDTSTEDEEEADSESEEEPIEHQPNQTGAGKTVKLADNKGIC